MTDSTRNPVNDLAELAERLRSAITSLLPGELSNSAGSPIDAAIRQALSNADLVPRAELDAHLAVLQRLEARVAELEARLDSDNPAG